MQSINYSYATELTLNDSLENVFNEMKKEDDIAQTKNTGTFEVKGKKYERRDLTESSFIANVEKEKLIAKTSSSLKTQSHKKSNRMICIASFTNLLFVLSMLFCIFIASTVNGPINFLPSFMAGKYSPSSSSHLVLLFGIMNVLSRVISGLIGRVSLRVRVSIIIIINLAGGAMSCAVSLWTSFTSMTVFTTVMGLTAGN